MDLARVIGTVVSTQKDSGLEGVQLCVIEPIDPSNGEMKPAARPLVASESSTPRSLGDVVYYVASGDAVHTHPDGRAMPVDAAIVGLVDEVTLKP